MSLYVIRHDEPALRGVFLGRTDPPLSDAGAEASRRKMAEVQAAIVYSSPLRRAIQTARMIACEAELVELADLRELDFGEWDGLTWEQVLSRWPELAGTKLRDWLGSTPPGGEAWECFVQRVDRALATIREGPKPAAIVAHLVVNSVIMWRLTGQPPQAFQQHYGEVLRVEL